MNHGERNELLIKIFLTVIKKNKDVSTIFGEIKNLGFGDEEYKTLDYEIDFKNLISKNEINKIDTKKKKKECEKKIKLIAGEMGITKAPPLSKADIYINKKGYSIKYLNAGRPSIVNHTSRLYWLRIAKVLGEDISKLDKIVANYWNLRLSGKIFEDCGNKHPLSPFKDHKKILKPYLQYFCFTGTGTGDSKYKAEDVLVFKNFDDPDSWVLHSKSKTIDEIWDGLYFCMRGGRGMDRYKDPNFKKIIEPWTRFTDNKYRGAISVRYDSK